jgi:hypothetical protein
MMRNISFVAASMIFAGFLSMGPRGFSDQTIDEWEALKRSLQTAKSIRPRSGFVPDESTAIKVGEAVAIAEYGENTIARERPFRAQLDGQTWFVKGTLHPEGSYGGTVVIKVSKSDGRILFMTHQE